jgi:heptosyltransferase-1
MKRLLIVLMGSLGDVARGFSLLPPIKKRFPDLHVTWLVEPKCAGVVRLHPSIDEVVVFDRGRGVLGLPELVRRLRSDSFDVVLDLQRHFKSGLFSRIAPSGRRIAFHPRNSKELNWIFHKEFIQEVPAHVSKVLHYRKFLEKMDIDSSGEIEFGLNALPIDLPEAMPGEAACIGIVLGSSWPSKDFPAQGYRVLLELLGDRCPEAQLLLLGDKSHVDLSQKLKAALPSGKIVELAGKTNLRQLLSVLRVCKVVVGPDSGPGHLSAAVKTPYVSIFGPTPPERVAPFGCEQLAIRSKIGCAPCWRRECPGLNKLCMRLVPVEEVADQVQMCFENGWTSNES